MNKLPEEHTETIERTCTCCNKTKLCHENVQKSEFNVEGKRVGGFKKWKWKTQCKDCLKEKRLASKQSKKDHKEANTSLPCPSLNFMKEKVLDKLSSFEDMEDDEIQQCLDDLKDIKKQSILEKTRNSSQWMCFSKKEIGYTPGRENDTIMNIIKIVGYESRKLSSGIVINDNSIHICDRDCVVKIIVDADIEFTNDNRISIKNLLKGTIKN